VAERGLPSWPKITIRLYDAHNGEVKIAGRSHPVVAADPRESAIAIVAERAAQLGRAVKATAVEPDGTSWPLVIHPDGQVDAIAVSDSDKKPIWPILVAAGAALVLIFGTVGYLVLRGPSEPPPPVASPTLPSLPAPEIKKDVFDARPYPPGFSKTANWSVDLAEGTVPAVSPDGTKVALITPASRIAMLDGTGKVLWQDDVPDGSQSPVFTTVDDKAVVAVLSSSTLRYWPVAIPGALPTEVDVPSQMDVQFFGTSPMAVSDEGDAAVLTGGKFVDIGGRPRRATFLLAVGKRALMAGYHGPEVWWGEPGKDPVAVNLTPPAGVKGIDHVALGSQTWVIVMWTKSSTEVEPAVHDAATGKVLATCPATSSADAGQWVPDETGKVAALGNCLIDFVKRKTWPVPDFEAVSVMGTSFFSSSGSSAVLLAPGGTPMPVSPDTARPWGIVAGQAVVVHNDVLYVLAPKK
jgi:hypothetical protein